MPDFVSPDHPPILQRPPASLSTLPPELKMRILELVVDDGDTISFDQWREILCCMSLVARSWLAMSQKLLLRKVYLGGPRFGGSNYDGLLAAVEAAKWAGCDQLVINGSSVERFESLLSRFREITEVTLYSCFLGRAFERLVTLDSCTIVRDVKLFGCDFATPDDNWLSPTRLVRIVSGGQTDRAPASAQVGLGHLVAASVSTLKHLELHLPLGPGAEMARAVFEATRVPQLASLSLDCYGLSSVLSLTQLLDVCPPVSQLVFDPIDLSIADAVLSNIVPAFKLKRWTVNLADQLGGSAPLVREWLLRPFCAELEVLTLSGPQGKVFAESRAARELVQVARERGA